MMEKLFMHLTQCIFQNQHLSQQVIYYNYVDTIQDLKKNLQA